jgi:hypothetical protein
LMAISGQRFLTSLSFRTVSLVSSYSTGLLAWARSVAAAEGSDDSQTPRQF